MADTQTAAALAEAQAAEAYNASVKQQMQAADQAAETAKYQAAFSQPRNDNASTSAAYDAIVAQYNARQYYSVGSGGLQYQPTGGPKIQEIQNPQNAAQIAYNVAITGGNLNQGLVNKSIQEGFNPTPYVNQPVQQQVATRQDIAQYDRVGNPLNSRAAYEQSMRNAQNPYGRAGYTNPNTLGDLSTQRILNNINQFRQPLATAGMPIASETAMQGNVLAAQLNRAISTQGTRDDQFFNNELQKWGENFVEKSSVYHHTAYDSGVPVPANPFEYQGDLAVEFLKGAPNAARPSEWFSPVSGEMGEQLPGGMGLQGAAWDTAKYGVAGVDFTNAVKYLNSKEGQYGPYGQLWGGPEYKENGHNAPQFSGIPTATPSIAELPLPFRSSYQDRSGGWLQGGKTIGGVAEISYTGIEGLPAPFRSTPQEVQEPSITDRVLDSVSRTAAIIPGGLGIALSLDVARGKPVIDTSNIYGSLNKSLAPYTTDISGIGRALKLTPDFIIGENPTFQNKAMNAANVGKNIYIGAFESPLDIAAGYVGGYAFGAGLGLAGRGIATAAVSDLPIVGAAGRAASTPLASDIGRLALVGAGAIMVGIAGKNIIEQPTTAERGQMLGKTAVGFAGFPIGYSGGSTIIPELANPYAGRTFFAQEARMGPIESAAFKAQTYYTSQFTENPAGYRAVASTIPGLRFVEPSVRAEPVFGETTKSGVYAPEIRSTLLEQEHAVYGSASLKQQYTHEISTEAGLRTPKDIDAFIKNPEVGIKSLQSRTGLSQPAAEGVLDLHNIPTGYPRLQASVVAEKIDLDNPRISSLSEGLYKRIATPRTQSEVIMSGDTGYYGQLTYESSAAQFGRKTAAVALVIERPIQTGFRAPKDVYDWVTVGRAQRLTDIARGNAESKYTGSDAAFERALNTELTIGTVKGQKPGDTNPTRTVTLRELFEEQRVAQEGIGGGKEEIPFGSTYGSRYQSKSPVGSPSSIASIYQPIGSVSSASASAKSVAGSGASPSDISSLTTSLLSSRSSPSPSPSTPSDIASITSPSRSPGSPSTPSFTPSPYPTSTPTPSTPPTPPYYPTSIISPPPSLIPPWVPSNPTPPETPRTPPRSPGSPGTPNVPPLSGGLLGSGGSSNKARRRRKRSIELFSFEMGEDTPIPTRYGLGGSTTAYVPGNRGIAVDILPAGDIAPNRLFDIGSPKRTKDHL